MTEADASPETQSSSRGLPFKVPANYDSRSFIKAGNVRVAVLVSCFDEALTIGNVVKAFKAALPQASIYVYDNNSRDGTATIAREAGAIVRFERRQGNGHVVRRMFADIDADIYLLVDGDDTYDATVAPAVIARMIEEGFDFVNVAPGR